MVESEHYVLPGTGGRIMVEPIRVFAYNLSPSGGFGLLSNDEIVPITNYYDEDGNNVPRSGDFTWFVCGPSVAGYWFTCEVADFTWKKGLDS